MITSGLPSRLVRSSEPLGWKNVRVEEYHDPFVAERFVASSPSLTLVRVTTGRYRIESRHGRHWSSGDYRPGSIGVTAPGNSNELRWRASSTAMMRSQHVHLDPGLAPAGITFPDVLSLDDSFVTASAKALELALADKAPAVYADSVAAALMAHLVYRVVPAPRPPAERAGPLSRGEIDLVIDYMRAHLASDIVLDDLAALVGLSKYHFLRTFAATVGETPARYLALLRLRHAAALLRGSAQPVATIAAASGYRSAGQFAAAFRREYGCTPRSYRR